MSRAAPSDFKVAFADKVVVITGASSGIGLALAQALAAAGAKIGLIARRQQLLTDLERQLYRDGTAVLGSLCSVATDVCDRDAVLAAINQISTQLGPVDILIANAGVSQILPVARFDTRKARLVYEVNVLGALHAIEAVLPSMLARRQGQIVGMASLAAYRSFPQSHAYCGSKAALLSQLDGLRLELRSEGIAVTTICPGFIRTPMTDVNNFKMPLLMEPERAAERILKAVVKKQKVLNFPRRLYWLIQLTRLLPDVLVAKLTTPPPDGFKKAN